MVQRLILIACVLLTGCANDAKQGWLYTGMTRTFDEEMSTAINPIVMCNDGKFSRYCMDLLRFNPERMKK